MNSILQNRILILDGAMGTMIQRYNLTESDYRGNLSLEEYRQYRGNSDMLCLTRPDVIEEIHRQYLEAGADIIETCSFSATTISMHDYGMEGFVREINLAAAQLARKAADEFTRLNPEKPRFVAGSIGPTNRTCSISPDVNDPSKRSITYDQLHAAYLEQMTALIDGGVDAFLIETVFDTLNAKAALDAALTAMENTGREVPLMLSVTLAGKAGRTLSGQTIGALLASVAHVPLLSIGLNCSFGAREMKPFLRELSERATCYVSAYPNAGLPNELGQYTETANEMIVQVKEFLDEGLVNIIGGCCGTTPEHIAAYNKIIGNVTIRKPAEKVDALQLSGLEELIVRPENNFLNIGERCNVAGSRKFLRLIKEKKYEEAAAIARQQVEDGAQVIDINMDDGLLEVEQEMTTFLNILMTEPDISRVPIMIDSSNFEAIEAGLKCVQGKSIVNSISLKEGEAVFLERAERVRRLGAAVVVMAFDEEGQAATFDRRIEVCSRAYRLLIDKLNYNPHDIIFDPNILSIATGMEEHRNYAVDFIHTVEWIKTNLPHARIIGGVSNLSFALRGNNYMREVIHSVFLYHAIRAGLDMGIVNPAESVIYEEIPADLLEIVEDVILNRRDDATERILEVVMENLHSTGGKQTIGNNWREESLEERLRHALVKGISDHLNEDLHEALNVPHSPLDIIDQYLMPAINYVGNLFGEGKMFLPQVVKTARTMKNAVAILQPYIEASGVDTDKADKKKVLMATVKGDVHDIGKNIVGVILACNGFEVVDLGVMVPADRIIEEAVSHKVDVVGLSGLITPSLEEMRKVAEAIQHAGFNIPLLIGGAATSPLHTALKIAPSYEGTTIHVKDAAVAPSVLNRLFHPTDGITARLEAKEENKRLVEEYIPKKLISAEEALANRRRIDWANYTPFVPPYKGTQVQRVELIKLIPLINWRIFLNLWKLNARFASVFTLHDCPSCRAKWLLEIPESDRPKAKEALQLYIDTQQLLNEGIRNNATVDLLIGFFDAVGTEDSIVLTDSNGESVVLPTPRQQVEKQEGRPKEYLSLCDFIAPENDCVGIFATSIGQVWRDMMEKETDDYRKLLMQALADRLAEAGAEYMQAITIGKEGGIRPAVGYPSLPDQQFIFIMDKVANLSQIGIELTENGAMYPTASVSGLVIANQQSRYFAI
ncbi:MAG: methionine synthase [Bacteroidales bacterium]